MTIIDAIKMVMRKSGAAITAREAYEEIIKQGLYKFHAQNPAHVVLTQIRRHSEGIDFPTAAPTKHFRLVGGNKFVILEEPRRLARTRPVAELHRGARADDAKSLAILLREIQKLHTQYILQLKSRVIAELRRLSPGAFEQFSRALLDVYGFEETVVTQVSRDGGIDGHGKLKVGLAHLNVSFQCKRWTKSNIQRPEIDKFRGASQGDFEQGIFFAITSFSEGAIAASIKRGAIPIVLVDSASIVELMMQKQFGIQAESLTIPTFALDLALSPERQQDVRIESDLGSKPNRKRERK